MCVEAGIDPSNPVFAESVLFSIQNLLFLVLSGWSVHFTTQSLLFLLAYTGKDRAFHHPVEPSFSGEIVTFLLVVGLPRCTAAWRRRRGVKGETGFFNNEEGGR